MQSDLYAFGLVLYELFTGHRPFPATDHDALQRQRSSHPSTTPTTLVPELGPRVERVILRGLEPDPRQRPASALEISATCRAAIRSLSGRPATSSLSRVGARRG